MLEIANSKWDIMQKKVDSLASEVFEEVVQTEMALANLEVAQLDSVIPEEVKVAERKSLLQRMNTLQMNLKFRKSNPGETPPIL